LNCLKALAPIFSSNPFAAHGRICCRPVTITTSNLSRITPLVEVKIMKIAIIGKGHVGSALCSGLSAKHETRFGHRDPAEPVANAAKWGDVIILAVPRENANDAVEEISAYADGKVVIDVMNAVGPNLELAISCATSSAEETQKKLPKAKVVKAFNTVFAANQSTGKIGKEQLTAFIAGDDLKAKQTVAQLTRDIGFDPIDCGPLKSARYLEAMAIMIINLAFTNGMGTKIGFKLVKA
jgi:8-hydroxy-5-deazaflavin:NADPH oxidoreductase